MKKLLYSFLSFFLSFSVHAQVVTSFELRYYKPDIQANGETDFRGETAVFNTEERVSFLKEYAKVASDWFGDPAYDTKVVNDAEVKDILGRIKPQPCPEVRKTISLKDWKYIGFRSGLAEERQEQISKWLNQRGAELKSGALVIEKGSELHYTFAPQAWRLHFSWQAKPIDTTNEVLFQLTDRQLITALSVGFGSDGRIFYSTAEGKRIDTLSYVADKYYEFKVELDLSGGDSQLSYGKQIGRYNLYVDGRLVADFVPIERGVLSPNVFSSIGQVNTFTVQANQEVELDNLLAYGYVLTNRLNYPYQPILLIDENFEKTIEIGDWKALEYDDSLWNAGELPVVIGSERHFQESLYLRKTVYVDRFEEAILNLEAFDPGGELWINNTFVARFNDRYPHKIDVSPYLRPNTNNLFCVKIDPFYLTKGVGELMVHSSLDLNIGWFCGRMSLDLVSSSHIDQVYVHTSDLKEEQACLKAKIKLNTRTDFKGKVILEAYPWFPVEQNKPITQTSMDLNETNTSEINVYLLIQDPTLWTPELPALYKIRAVLFDEKGGKVDDFVTTTGIRTVDQQGGMFRLNGELSMLNGAQIMGFRSPLDQAVVWNRCPPAEWLIKELLMVKKMNGNLLRIHVHAWENSPAEGINDPRIAEFADQLGVMLIWTTPSWTRTGDDWRKIDFNAFPKYIYQVFNHPSIVLWEASNHPDKFKKGGVEESNAFCEKIYNTIFPVDSSRLISFTSYMKHLHYGDDAGTVDYVGNPITASPAYTAPMVTRGNQDAPTGYSNDWFLLRKWGENAYMKSLLGSKDRAYFNFEHQESMAQPNWELLKGKPYYRMHSYEWGYDEGTIGRRLKLDEWKESQAWQAFSAWEAIKKMRRLGYDGFSWCSLHGGPNSGTYHKPIIDMHGHAKLAYWTNKMIFQKTVAGSDNVDVVYGPSDRLTPVILHWGKQKKATLTVRIKEVDGSYTEDKTYKDIHLPEGRESIVLLSFKPAWKKEGYYQIEYILTIM